MNEQANWDEATDAAWREGFDVGRDIAAGADRIAELEAALREIDHAFEVNLRIDIEGGGFGWPDPIRDIARRALGDSCKHDWYRAAGSPPDICLKCQKLEDRG